MTTRNLLSRVGSLVADLVRRGMRGAGALVKTLYLQGETWILDGKRASYGIAVTRILLGVMMLGLMLTNFSTRFYTWGAGMAWSGQFAYPGNDFVKMWPFTMFHDQAQNPFLFTVLYLVAMALAVSFAIGYRTRLSQFFLFFFWVAMVESNSNVNDQSDNLTRIALMVMFFAAPGDRWSVDARRRRIADEKAEKRGKSGVFLVRWWRFQKVVPEHYTNILHNFAIIALACQVSFIYVSGGLYKAGGAPWSGGTAIYDPIHVTQFGPWPELSAFVTTWGPGVAFATLLTLMVQVSFPLLLMRRGTRIFALIVMLGFHIGIAVLMGLPWFSLAMIAIDAIFIRDVTYRELSGGLVKAWRRTRSTPVAGPGAEAPAEAPAETPSEPPVEAPAEALAEPAEVPVLAAQPSAP
ncbi:HTTM domain-containing protein [Leifsonia lichenia]